MTHESIEKFVYVWQRSQSLDEVAAKLGIRRGSASRRACRYRKSMGIGLKLFHRHKRAAPAPIPAR